MSEEFTTTPVLGENTESPTVTEEPAGTIEIAEEETKTDEVEGAEPSESTETTEESKGAEPTVEESKGAEKRIKQLVAQKHEAEQKAQILEQMLKQQQQTFTQTQATVEQLVEPKSEDFETWEQFQAAERQYTINLAKQQMAEQQANMIAEQRVAQRDQLFNARLSAAAIDDPSLTGLVTDQSITITPVLAHFIKESEFGPKILKHLGANKALGAELSALHPIMMAKEIGKLEEKLSAQVLPDKPQVKHVTAAPEPIKTVTPKRSNNLIDDSTPTEEWIKRRNQAQFKRR